MNRVRVAFGILDLKDLYNSGTVIGPVSNPVIHPNYSSNTFDSDIAMLSVDVSRQDVESKALPINLPPKDYSGATSAVVSGWGTIESGGTSPDVLRFVRKPVVNVDACRNTMYDPTWLTETMICSGESGKDACQGDSGGPLAVGPDRNGDNDILIGIVSWGVGCGLNGYPGVYADVTKFVEWIESYRPN